MHVNFSAHMPVSRDTSTSRISCYIQLEMHARQRLIYGSVCIENS